MAILTIAALNSAAAPSAAAQCSLAPGSVVQLLGTPHLFIVDHEGTLHWGGDTRGLAGRVIAWDDRCTVTLQELQELPRGNPWLSSGLPKIGEPIYLSKWETEETAPTLLRIQSIPDVELFGIQTSNYGNYVIDRARYEREHSTNVGTLMVGPLASAASFAMSPSDQATYGQLLLDMKTVESATLARRYQMGEDPSITLPRLADCEALGLREFDRSRGIAPSMEALNRCIAGLNLGGSPGPSAPSVPGIPSLPAPPAPLGPPAVPSNLATVLTGANQVQLSWQDNSTNETQFRVYRNGALTGAAAGTNITSTAVADAAPAGACYTVTAFSATLGESAHSTPSCLGAAPAAPPAGPPPAPGPNAPTNVVAALGPTNQVQVSWQDNSTNETEFRIYRNGVAAASTGGQPNVNVFNPDRRGSGRSLLDHHRVQQHPRRIGAERAIVRRRARRPANASAARPASEAPHEPRRYLRSGDRDDPLHLDGQLHR
jgi:hypothetical protein